MLSFQRIRYLLNSATLGLGAIEVNTLNTPPEGFYIISEIVDMTV